ncbi:hypothetical protein ABZW30_37880 [Kitasatospora sp. NPDC004669]|uniref:hypothetical protein n=1 Tax=Kitasatospora sp. NPDC004669 TaxID=3154555 RepID=UPI0033A10A60
MTSTDSPRRVDLVCCAAALGLAAAGLLAVHVPPPTPARPRPHPAGAAGPAVAGAPARLPSGPTRTGVRALLPGPVTTGFAVAALAGGLR